MSEQDALKLSLSALIRYAQSFLQRWGDPRERASEFLLPLNSNDEALLRLAEALATGGEVSVAQWSEPIRLRSIFDRIEPALLPDRAGGYPLQALDRRRETLFPQRPRPAATEGEYRALARSLREALQGAERFARGHPAAQIAGLLGAMARFAWCVPAASADAFEKTVEFVPSDTLFAALVAVAVEQWGRRAAQAIEEAFGGPEPPFLLTGAFPALPQLRFFPRPAAWSPGPGKALKRLRWVSEGLFARIAQGEPVKSEDLFPSEGGEEPERTLAKIAPVRLLREEQSRLPRPMQRGDLAAWRLWDAAFQRPAVVVSRSGGRTFLYDVAMARYSPQVSWWVAFAWGARADETAWPGGPPWRGLVESALQALGDRGIGGMRSRGGGAFHLEPDRTPLSLKVEAAPYVVTLSRYHPRSEELQAGVLSDHGATYRLVTVGGWAAIPGRPDQPRRPIGMIEAGAVLRADGRFPLGTLVDARLNPNDRERFPHPLWRYGLAFPIPWAGPPPASDRSSEGRAGKPESDPEEASDGPVSVADHHPE